MNTSHFATPEPSDPSGTCGPGGVEIYMGSESRRDFLRKTGSATMLGFLGWGASGTSANAGPECYTTPCTSHEVLCTGSPYSISAFGETSIVTWDENRCAKGQFITWYNASRTGMYVLMQVNGWIAGATPPSYLSYSPQAVMMADTCPFNASGPHVSTVYCDLGNVSVSPTLDHHYYGYMQFDSTDYDNDSEYYVETTGKIYIKRNTREWMGSYYHEDEEYSPELYFTVKIAKIAP